MLRRKAKTDVMQFTLSFIEDLGGRSRLFTPIGKARDREKAVVRTSQHTFSPAPSRPRIGRGQTQRDWHAIAARTHSVSKYLNNIIEKDHRRIKQRV
jgi:transposase-like protein